MAGRITILGCGSSGGVPRVGQGWGFCDPNEPRNRRRRCSILLEETSEGASPTCVLVDTSPDLRDQLLTADIRRLDGVILTHEHADHMHGLDDLRPLTMMTRRRLDVYADGDASRSLLERFGYCFQQRQDYPAILNLHTVERGHPISIVGEGGRLSVDTFRVGHGQLDVLGLKFRNVAYTPDLNMIPAESIAPLEGLDLWIIDALRQSPHPTHFSLYEALDWIERLKPRRAILTNLHTDLDYNALCAQLPDHIVPAYDGMQIDIP